MKAQLIILFLLFSVVSTEAYASENEPVQTKKKTEKSKYDFNIFKLYSFIKAQPLSDSLNIYSKNQANFRKQD